MPDLHGSYDVTVRIRLELDMEKDEVQAMIQSVLDGEPTKAETLVAEVVSLKVEPV